jgi:DNA-binding SARP family transcriptional activator
MALVATIGPVEGSVATQGSVATTISVSLLGGFSVAVDGRQVPAPEWRRRQAAALVKILALTPGRSMHRERLVDTIWPDLDMETAAPRLHKAAHYARRSLGDPFSVVLGGDAVALFPQATVEVDALRFESAAESALRARDPQQAAAAAEQYGGDLLPDDLYEPWTEQARDRLRLLHLDVLRLAGRWEALAAADPTDEQAHLTLMRMLADVGDGRSALRQFERLERELSRELGVAPSQAAIRLRDSLVVAEDEPPVPDVSPSGDELFGRDTERARTAELLDTVGRGRGHVLFVSGAAGVGKSTLLADLEAVAARQRMRVGSGVAARIAGDWPYAPVLEALSDLCRHHPALLDGLDDNFREQIERALSGRQFVWDGQAAHQRLFVATAELLRLAAAGAGAVLVLDDAHDADEASLRLLHYLVRSTKSERVLVVVGHRPVTQGVLADVRGSLLGRAGGAGLDLAPLGRDDCAQLASLHAPGAPASVLDAIYHASAGLPFVVNELARAWSADPTTTTRAVWLPAGLSRGAQAALATAAVLGTSLDTDEFAAVTGLPDDDVYTVLDESVALRVLRRTAAGYVFRHALIRDALLESAGPRRTGEAHRQAARTLEQLGRSSARIGHHLVQAGEARAAVPWMIRAGETEAALGAYREALASLESVDSAAEGADRARLLALRADLLSACGDRGAIDAYRGALDAAVEPDDRARLRTGLARAATFAGDLDTAELALTGLDLDGGDNDPALLLARGNLAYFRHDFAAADQAAAEARLMIGLGVSQDRRLFDLLALQGLLAHHRGEWFQRLRLELRNGMGRPDLAVGIFDSHLCVAEYLLYGPTPYDDVLRLAADLRATAERAGVLRAVAFATALRGEAALLKGDLELAESELLDAADLHHDLESPAGEAHSLQRLAEVHLAHGDRDTAMGLLQRALPLARWSTIGLHLLQRIYGSMIAAAADPDLARAVVDRAESALGREDQCAFCSIMWAVPAAQACADVGDLDAAAAYLELAEKSEALWEGTSWQAHLLEVRAHLANAEERVDAAERLMDEAAEVFAAAGQPLDAARCRAGLTSPRTPAA